MLLVHQAGSVKIGEVVRYTLTYTPSNDRILPTPPHLHLKVKNTSAIPLRAAWVHGPYTLHVSAYPSTFNPHHKVDHPKRDGVPEYEPMVKAGGSWTSKLLVPEDIRETGADLGRRRSYHHAQESSNQEKGKVTWIIEIASQILFSNSASVGFEVLVGRDERSLELGFAAVAGHGHGGPAHIRDLQTEKERREARKRNHVQYEGVYSKAVRLVVEDTETLWDKPPLPAWDNEKDGDKKGQQSTDGPGQEKKNTTSDAPRKRKNVHLVVVTHGLHSNLGADMLFLKESIDATVAQARADAKKRKERYRASRAQSPEKSGEDVIKDKQNGEETATAPLTGGQDDLDNAPGDEDDDDDEETIVRGFNGNATRTENGIQYLGKRLAKYILRFTYPDQPFLPIKKNLTRKLTDTFTSDAEKAKRDGKPSHHGSSIHTPQESAAAEDLPYKFTSISFIGHSLGGLVQTYAVAYIHKHSPTFFQQIKPVNFICMASPMLGLSNENPMYIKFALDFGLVGRTGQDLGLTWRAPTIANKGWNAMMSPFSGTSGQKEANDKRQDPSAKPLLRILPTGPAHQVLRMFRNRTVYSNVVNDGIVPLRTSCLLFLDWKGLGKVEKARRENGLIGTVAEWGWAELTGANASTLAPNVRREQPWESEDDNSPVRKGQGTVVPLPAENETAEDSKRLSHRMSYEGGSPPDEPGSQGSSISRPEAQDQDKGMLDTFFGWFKPAAPAKPSKKTTKILQRGQTMYNSNEPSSDNVTTKPQHERTTSNPTMRPHLQSTPSNKKRPIATRGDSMTNSDTGDFAAPPKTSIFESAGDILHPPLPSQQWICDPSARSRTIFHDRVYHPDDIPPPPTKRNNTRISRAFSPEPSRQSTMSLKDGQTPSTTHLSNISQETLASNASSTTVTNADASGMKVEEKIARAYHRDLSWRKVLVRLEPDAHNNIIVRRMFANAYGWPVVKHLCDTHFADTYAARTRDEEEPARERAKPMDEPIDADRGEEVSNQTDKIVLPRTNSETREARDELASLAVPRSGVDRSNSARRSVQGSSFSSTSSSQRESVVWDDSLFETSDGDDSDAVDERNLVARFLNPNLPLASVKKEQKPPRSESSSNPSASSSRPPPSATAYADGHRGLAPTSPTSPEGVEGKGSDGAEVQSASPADAVKPTFQSEDVEALLHAGSFVEEPASMESQLMESQLVESQQQHSLPTSPGSAVADMGLRKSVEEWVGASGKRPRNHVTKDGEGEDEDDGHRSGRERKEGAGDSNAGVD